jgi:predicted ATPase
VPADLDALCIDLLRRRPHDRPSGGEVLRRLGSTTRSSARAIEFVGRTHELAALHEAYAAGAWPRVVLVSGSPGIGKSALVGRFLRAIQRQAPTPIVLSGRCYEREAVPYKAFDELVDVLAEYLRELPTAQQLALLPDGFDALARVFPVMRRLQPRAASAGETLPSDARAIRKRAGRALRQLLANLGSTSPVVLSIDDLQWADTDSIALLVELLRGQAPPRMLLVAAFRGRTCRRANRCRNCWRPSPR